MSKKIKAADGEAPVVEGKKPGKAKKILSIILNVFVYLFFALCIFSLVVTINAKKKGEDAITIFGKQARIVVSSSMEDSIKVKSMVFIDTVPEDEEKAVKWYSKLKVGDILTFKYNGYVQGQEGAQPTITHRIVEIKAGRDWDHDNDPSTPDIPSFEFRLKGDNVPDTGESSYQIFTTTNDDPFSYVIGKVTGKSYFLGLVVTGVRSPIGIVCIIIVPCLIIMGFEVFRLVNALTEKKRTAEKEKQVKRDTELEELKRQLLAYQQGTIPVVEQSSGEAQPVAEQIAEESPVEESTEEETKREAKFLKRRKKRSRYEEEEENE